MLVEGQALAENFIRYYSTLGSRSLGDSDFDIRSLDVLSAGRMYGVQEFLVRTQHTGFPAYSGTLQGKIWL